MKRLFGYFCLAAVLLFAFPKTGASQELGDYFERTFRHVALEYLVSLRNVPGMPDHFVAAQQGGRISAFSRNQSWGIRSVYDISDRLVNMADHPERGLLVATPHPQFVDNGFLYFTYSTVDTDTTFVSLSRITLNPTDSKSFSI